MREQFYEAIRTTANVGWNAFQAVNRRVPARAFHPAWSPEPLPKSHERTKPPLGYPRRTDSLCPTCTREVRDAIVGGTRELRELVDGRPGEIPADIVLRGNEIWMVKTCPKHGTFEDLMASDARFFGRLEENFFGRDVKIAKDALHDHGSASIKYGRGAVLTVDLTNRCNMMCNPCFMDANQVGYVHELSFADIREILDNAVSIKPRRQLSVQFSGGEPTISPFFLEATRYAKEIGYFSVQCATNGIRFAQEPQFAKAAYDSGLRLAYLQFDGVGNEHNNHRGVGNLYDVKLQALDNLHAAGVDVTLVTTLVNSVNNDQVGDILRFAIRNIDKINAVSFQPVSFTGRDEEIDDETRKKQRYTLAHLAHDVKDQAGIGEPMRDWFPLSASGPFSDLKDLLGGLEAQWGSLKCGCHPNCGIATMLLVHPESGDAVPVTQLLDADRLRRDLTVVTDSARGRFLTVVQTALSLARNIRPAGVPKNLGVWETLKGHGRAHGPGYGDRETGALPLARPPRGRHVVPGPLQLRLSPHGDVHHSVRDPARRDLVLRLQHRRWLAEDRRGDVPERHAGRVVQRQGPPPRVRPRQARPSPLLRAGAAPLHAARVRAVSAARRAPAPRALRDAAAHGPAVLQRSVGKIARSASATTAFAVSSGFSSGTRCPAPGTVTRLTHEARPATAVIASASDGGAMASSSPTTTRSGFSQPDSASKPSSRTARPARSAMAVEGGVSRIIARAVSSAGPPFERLASSFGSIAESAASIPSLPRASMASLRFARPASSSAEAFVSKRARPLRRSRSRAPCRFRNSNAT